MEFVNESTESYWISYFRKRVDLLADSEIGSITTEPGYMIGLLDREIEVISGLVQSYKARRNAISPISRLPPEILVLIFKAYRDDDANALRDRDRKTFAELSEYCSSCRVYYSLTYIAELPEHLGWMECSRVCQSWRNIIFGTPSLWSDIIIEWGPSWLQRFLKYSQSVSTIRFLGYLAEPRRADAQRGRPKPSVSDLARADRISLGAEFLSTLNPFLRGFRFSSTILRTIELTVTTSVGKCFTPEDDVVPLGLLLHNFPILERISLRDCLVNWEPPPLPSHSLRFMEVLTDERRTIQTGDSDDFDNAKSASEFLRSTPMLEILTLVYCFPSQYHEDTGTEKPIELPCLRELVLEEGDDQWCSYFFGRLLEIPATLHIRLRFSSDLGGGDGKHLIMSHLQRRFHDVNVASGYLALLSAKDSQCPGSESEWTTYWKVHTHVISGEAGSLEAPTQAGVESERHMDLCVRPRYPEGVRKMTVSYEACSSLPPLFVRTLVIEYADARLWEILAERFPSITSITCLSERAIFSDTKHFVLFDELISAFPKLAILKLRYMQLEEAEYMSAKQILALLRVRKALRRPIGRLVLELCHPCSTWLDVVRDFIEHVEVV